MKRLTPAQLRHLRHVVECNDMPVHTQEQVDAMSPYDRSRCTREDGTIKTQDGILDPRVARRLASLGLIKAGFITRQYACCRATAKGRAVAKGE